MGACRLCGRSSITISDVIGVCSTCLRAGKGVEIALDVHARLRLGIELVPTPPRGGKARCRLCVNECEIPEGGLGFCGVWTNRGGKLVPRIGYGKALVHYYLDPHPTNCVAVPVCPAATGCGYPKYAVRDGTEYGYYNLAVFFAACNLDCLFCQNWEYKHIVARAEQSRSVIVDIEELVRAAMSSRITCVCYFGGDPTPFAPYAIEASRRIIEEATKRGQVKRICWETNGLAHPSIMREFARLSLVSGGIVKIDWKAWTPEIYTALTGVDGHKALERLKTNTKIVAEMARQRPEIPLLVVSTLLVPGYVDAEEVRKIAEYLASLDIDVPYVLLAFHPDHYLRDLPPTSRRHAEEALREARRAGLKRVFIGNEWLLGEYY